jgi:hypothetical protein
MVLRLERAAGIHTDSIFSEPPYQRRLSRYCNPVVHPLDPLALNPAEIRLEWLKNRKRNFDLISRLDLHVERWVLANFLDIDDRGSVTTK